MNNLKAILEQTLLLQKLLLGWSYNTGWPLTVLADSLPVLPLKEIGVGDFHVDGCTAMSKLLKPYRMCLEVAGFAFVTFEADHNCEGPDWHHAMQNIRAKVRFEKLKVSDLWDEDSDSFGQGSLEYITCQVRDNPFDEKDENEGVDGDEEED